jgi:two-component system invasion response regulator UvrY
MARSRQITVLLVDDHPVVRDGYRRLLENTKDIRVVAEADDGEEALKLYAEHQPDVVVLDMSMPGIGGLETIRRIKKVDASARVLVFSMHDSKVMVTRAIETGAAGYLTKQSGAGQMVEAIQQVAGGKAYLDQAVVPDIVQAQFSGSDPLARLSKREFQVFRNLAEGKPVVEIAELLTISPKTVGVHQTHIMKKLDLRNGAELTRLAIRCGVIQA